MECCKQKSAYGMLQAEECLWNVILQAVECLWNVASIRVIM